MTLSVTACTAEPHQPGSANAVQCRSSALLAGELYAQDFETCSDWFTRSSERAPVVTTVATPLLDVAPVGPRAALIDWATLERSRAYYSSWQSPIPVTPGQPHCLDLWTSYTGAGLRYGIRHFDSNQVDLAREDVLVASSDYEQAADPGEPFILSSDRRDWQHAKKTFTPPAGTQHVQVFGALVPGDETLTPDTVAYLDGVRVWRGPCDAEDESAICSAADTSRGLVAEYFDNRDFTNPKVTRLEGPVSFDWGTGSPDPVLGSDTFSVRFTGYVVSRFTELVTFTTRSNDGVRLTVDGRRIIDNFTDHAVTENSGGAMLFAGQRTPITLEYYENTGSALIELLWQSASQPREVIPRSQLSPSASTCTASSVLVAHYGLDDSGVSAADATCNGSFGTLREFPTTGTWGPGRNGGPLTGSLTFNGTSAWVRVPRSPALDSVATTGQLTVAAWIKPAAVESGSAYIVSRQVGSSGDDHFALAFRDGRVSFELETQDAGTSRCSATAVSPVDVWQHVAGTYDGKVARAYVDGVEVCRFDRVVTLRADTTPLILGGNANSSSDDAQDLLRGSLDEVAIYNRALTPADLVAISTGGSCAVAAPPVTQSTPGELLVEEVGFSGQAPATFTPSLVDPVTGQIVSPTCTPASGSSFSLGTTAVTCTATVATRTLMSTFDVRVSPRKRSNRVALLVAGSASLGASDQALRQALEARGYDVVVRSDGTVTTADATGKALIVLSSSVSSGEVTTKFKDTRVPAIVLEPNLFDDMRLTGSDSSDGGERASQTAVVITRPTHPLAAGLSGRVTVTSSPQTFVWGKPSSTAIKVATTDGNAGESAIFAYATGDTMVGMAAPARRVGFFAGPNSPAALTESGRRLLDAAITWATQSEALLVVNDAASLSPSDMALRDRLTRLGYGVVARRGADVSSAEAESADLVFVSESTPSPTVDGRLNGVRRPIISAEPFLWDDLGMVGTNSTDSGYATGQTRLDILQSGHPMAAGLQGTVTTTSAPGRFGWGHPNANAVSIASVQGQSAQVAIFGYPTGASMVGATAAGRRVGLFLDRDVPATLTADGWKLVDAAVRWAAQPEALLVVGGTPLHAGDMAVSGRLTALGFGVVSKLATALVSTDAQGMATVVVSKTVSSTDVLDKLRDARVPVLNLEPLILDDMQMCGLQQGTDYGETAGQTQIVLTNPAHPMAAGLSGTVSVVTTANTFVWGKPSSNAEKVATLVGSPDRAALFGYRAGATMVPLEAPARRVGAFAGQDASAALTPDGGKLLDAAIKWTVAW